MPGITFLYSYFFLLQRTYPLAQLSLELGNTPSMLVVIGCFGSRKHTLFLKLVRGVLKVP